MFNFPLPTDQSPLGNLNVTFGCWHSRPSLVGDGDSLGGGVAGTVASSASALPASLRPPPCLSGVPVDIMALRKLVNCVECLSSHTSTFTPIHPSLSMCSSNQMRQYISTWLRSRAVQACRLASIPIPFLWSGLCSDDATIRDVAATTV